MVLFIVVVGSLERSPSEEKKRRRRGERGINEAVDYRLIFKIKKIPLYGTVNSERNEFICDTERVVWQDLGARKRSSLENTNSHH